MASPHHQPTHRSLLLIADIGGYTDYMRSHRMSLAHAEVNTSRLLERVVDAAPGFDLVEIEGDAAFLSRPIEGLSEKAAVATTLRSRPRCTGPSTSSAGTWRRTCARARGAPRSTT
jgi:hypothetical protein